MRHRLVVGDYGAAPMPRHAADAAASIDNFGCSGAKAKEKRSSALPRQSSIDLSSECTESERGLIRRVLSEANLSGRHLEIGTAAGGTLKEMIGVYADRETCPQFVVIDPFTYFDDQLKKV